MGVLVGEDEAVWGDLAVGRRQGASADRPSHRLAIQRRWLALGGGCMQVGQLLWQVRQFLCQFGPSSV